MLKEWYTSGLYQLMTLVWLAKVIIDKLACYTIAIMLLFGTWGMALASKWH
jgi:hypothetical protein